MLPRFHKQGLIERLRRVGESGEWPTSFNCAQIALVGREKGLYKKDSCGRRASSPLFTGFG